MNEVSLKRQLAKRYIPSSMKWKLALKGLGKLYRTIYDELEKHGYAPSGKPLAHAAYQVGLDCGKTMKQDFGLGSSINDIAFAIEVDHRIFGMKAAVAERTERKIVYHCYECAWKKYFTLKLCIAIGKAEKGIAHALNSKAKCQLRAA